MEAYSSWANCYSPLRVVLFHIIMGELLFAPTGGVIPHHHGRIAIRPYGWCHSTSSWANCYSPLRVVSFHIIMGELLFAPTDSPPTVFIIP
ncbi:MAG: hypothetical protein J5767_02360 [Paludibacteraceae bacterium]|nr:hypothetical protein [Paludibacteraceae bacterium]